MASSASLIPVLIFFLLSSSAPFLAFASEPRNPEGKARREPFRCVLVCAWWWLRVLVAVEALIAIRDGLVDPHGVLNNWDQYSVDPCSWAMITCSAKNLVVGL
jgi:hypothetical protein